MSTPTVADYRTRIPIAHNGVPNVVVETFLADAVTALDATVFGTRLVEACVWWAAARIEHQVQLGLYPTDSACNPPAVDMSKVQKPDQTAYWVLYLQIQNSRAGSGPFVVTQSC